MSKADGAELLTRLLPMTSLVGMVATGGRVLDDRNGFEPPEFEKLGSVGPETIFISN